MSEFTAYRITVEGEDVTSNFEGRVQSIEVSDRTGAGTDVARIIVNDAGGVLAYPRTNAKIAIALGTRSSGLRELFAGNVDEVISTLTRGGGMELHVTAKGFDTSTGVKTPQNRHFDDMTIGAILAAAGEAAGVDDVRVDEELSAIVRDYEAMDNESFLAFGQRLAKEIGGTFKIRNNVAVMAKKGAARSPGGVAFEDIRASRGVNLLECSVAPYMGRGRYKEIRVKYYDRAKGERGEVVLTTNVEGSDAIAVGRFEAPTKARAEEMAEGLKTDSERASAAGSVAINGNPFAQAEGIVEIAGVRSGVDGRYIIEGVDHAFSRSGGYVTRLTLANRIQGET